MQEQDEVGTQGKKGKKKKAGHSDETGSLETKKNPMIR
jgi:hypothetical protein